MRPIPAPRLGDAHGLLRAINERERLRLDEFVTEFAVEDLFPPGLENALGRTRQFVSFARAAGLVDEDRGTVALTDMGKRYVRAGDAERPFDVSAAQAEWLRRLLRERHMTDSIYHGAAVALSLCASNPPDFRASALDFGRAISHLGRAGWDNENTFESQGERYGTFLRDLDLVDADRRLTPTGATTRDELTLPIHASLKDLAGQLNPDGLEGAIRDGESEAAAAALAPDPPLEEAAPPAAEPVAAPAPAPAPGGEDEYHDVGPGAGPSREAAPLSQRMPAVEPAASAPPAPPPDVWEVAAPEERTQAYRAITPDQEAAAAAPPPAATPAAEPVAPPPVEPVATPPAEPVAPPAPEPVATPAPPEPVAAAPVAPPPAAPPAALPASDPLAHAAAAATVSSPAPSAAFIPATAIRAAAEEAGLRLPASAYAAVAAALAGGHVVLAGPPQSGKTALALAIAKAAAQSGRSEGVTVVTASPHWTDADTVGRPGDEEWERGAVVTAASRGRWLVIDALDRADLDAALGDLSSLLAGVPVTLPDGEIAAPDGWRVVATAGPAGLAGPPALLGRFAHVRVPAPDDADLQAAIQQAAGGDPTAAAAARRLLGARELGPVGTGAFLAAARFAAARNAAAPADEATLAREALAAHVAPLLRHLDDDGRRRLAALAG